MSYEERVKKLLCLKEDGIGKMRAFFGKNEDDVKQDISIIREWLRQQPHLPEDEGDERLERFLVCNKFRLEVTKTKFENCYTYRSTYPEVMIYYDVRGEAYKKALKSFIVVPLPRLTDKMERIIFVKLLENPDFDPYHFFVVCIVLEMLQTYDTSVKFIFLCDYGKLTFEDVTKIDFALMQKSLGFIINSICATFSHVININAPTYFELMLKLFKMGMKPKLFARFSTHSRDSKLENVYKILPKEFLPIEFGGQNGSIEKLHTEWLSIINDHPEVFKEIVERKSIEELRTGDMKANELFGVEGSFKKLNLD